MGRGGDAPDGPGGNVAAAPRYYPLDAQGGWPRDAPVSWRVICGPSTPCIVGADRTGDTVRRQTAPQQVYGAAWTPADLAR